MFKIANKWFHTRRSFIGRSFPYGIGQDISIISHLYIWYLSYKKVVPQVILNFKWSSSKENSLTNKIDKWMTHAMTWGECPTKWYQGQRSYVVSQEQCHSNTYGDVHKKCKIQASTIYPNAILCHNKMHTFSISIKWFNWYHMPFMEIDDKGGEVGTKIWSWDIMG